MTSIEQVKEFHEVFNLPIASEPCIPDDKDNSFRIDFLQEELEETAQAIDANNIVEFVDGLADIQYVLDGWFLNAGLLKYKDAIMAEVHRSNMTKACKTWEEAQKTVDFLTPPGIITTPLYGIYPVGDYLIVKREADGKVMKSINYSKPDLQRILNKKLHE